MKMTRKKFIEFLDKTSEDCRTRADKEKNSTNRLALLNRSVAYSLISVYIETNELVITEE